MAVNAREAGFGHLIGRFDAVLTVTYVDADVVRTWLPAGTSLGPAGPAPEGTHPILVFVARGTEIRWSPVPLWLTEAEAVAVMVSGVTVQAAAHAGPFCYVARWWSGPGIKQRLGARMMGLPSAPEIPIIPPAMSTWTAEVPGMLKFTVSENGRQPNWPRIRKLCTVIQQPLLAVQPDGQLGAAGLYWNLGDTDMRTSIVNLELQPEVFGLPKGSAEPIVRTIDGTSNREAGVALRLGSDWTLTRKKSPDRNWGNWRARPSMRLRADMVLIDPSCPRPTGPVEEED